MTQHWKHDGVRVIGADSLDPDTAQTPVEEPQAVRWIDPTHPQ